MKLMSNNFAAKNTKKLDQNTLLAPDGKTSRLISQPEVNLEQTAAGKTLALPSYAQVKAPLGLHHFTRFGINFRDLMETAGLSQSKELKELMGIEDYLNLVKDNPRLLRGTHQRAWDMVNEQGYETVEKNGRTYEVPNFFRNPKPEMGFPPLLGIEEPLVAVTDYLKKASIDKDTRKKMLLMVGPQGSGKSSIANMLQKGCEEYSKTDEGAMYTLKLVNLPPDWRIENNEYAEGFYVNPILAMPERGRRELQKYINSHLPDGQTEIDITSQGLPPGSAQIIDRLTKYYQHLRGANAKPAEIYAQVMNHVKAERFIVDEKAGRGIGTIHAKDNKSMNIEEMIGTANLSMLGKYSESDPLGYDWKQGAFFAGAGGIIQLIEAFKLDEKHMIHLMTLCEERQVKPSNNIPLTDVDALVIAHTNEPEYKRKFQNADLEAFFSRIVRVTVPFITEVSANQKIVEYKLNEMLRKINLQRAKDQPPIQAAPHLAEMIALLQTLSVLQVPEIAETITDPNGVLYQKALLYDGQTSRKYGATEGRRWREQGIQNGEGMTGLSMRTLQDIIPALAVLPEVNKQGAVDAIHFINFMEGMLNQSTHTHYHMSGAVREKAKSLLPLIKSVLKEKISNDVTTAINADQETLERYATKYLSNIKAWRSRSEVVEEGMPRQPDEVFMQRVEQKLYPKFTMNKDKTPKAFEDFRNNILMSIGSRAGSGQEYNLLDDPEFKKAIAEIAGEDSKDSVNLQAIFSEHPTTLEQRELNTLFERMAKLGYNEISARRAIKYIMSDNV